HQHESLWRRSRGEGREIGVTCDRARDARCARVRRAECAVRGPKDSPGRAPRTAHRAPREARIAAHDELGGQSMLRGSSVIGLDIGSSQIKAVYMERRKQAWQLVSAGAVPTPLDSVQEGVVQDTDAVAESLRGLC